MRQLATIQKIIALNPIQGADLIEVATILGWEVVVKKGEFKVGDLCVYCEIDSILPEREEFEFLRDRKFRIRTIKLKKQVSQGIAFPLTILQKLKAPKLSDWNIIEGQDVTEWLGIKKYDPQAQQEEKLLEERTLRAKTRLQKFLLRHKWYRNLIFKPARKPFPSFIKKTDETRIQNVPSILEELKNDQLTITEKLDGQSATYFVVKRRGLFRTKYIFGVCSRNFQLCKEDNSSYWTIAREKKIKEMLISLMKKDLGTNYIVIQGEIIGEGIQGNKYNIKGYDFYAFNLLNDKLGLIFETSAEAIIKSYNIKWVPILSSFFIFRPTISENVNYSKGYSVLNTTVIREGIVVRRTSKIDSRHNRSIKIINPDFLLKNDE